MTGYNGVYCRGRRLYDTIDEEDECMNDITIVQQHIDQCHRDILFHITFDAEASLYQMWYEINI